MICLYYSRWFISDWINTNAPKTANISYKILTQVSWRGNMQIKEGDMMLAKNYSDVRNHFKETCDTVIHDSTQVVVKRKNDEDVVIISLEEYNNMKENLYVRESSVMYDRIMEAEKQIELGDTVDMTAEELKELLNE